LAKINSPKKYFLLSLCCWDLTITTFYVPFIPTYLYLTIYMVFLLQGLTIRILITMEVFKRCSDSFIKLMVCRIHSEYKLTILQIKSHNFLRVIKSAGKRFVKSALENVAKIFPSTLFSSRRHKKRD